jgi:hypothetical protein
MNVLMCLGLNLRVSFMILVLREYRNDFFVVKNQRYQINLYSKNEDHMFKVSRKKKGLMNMLKVKKYDFAVSNKTESLGYVIDSNKV